MRAATLHRRRPHTQQPPSDAFKRARGFAARVHRDERVSYVKAAAIVREVVRVILSCSIVRSLR